MATSENTKVSSFKTSENIQKKEGGPDCTVSNNKFSSVTLYDLAFEARGTILKYLISRSKFHNSGLFEISFILSFKHNLYLFAVLLENSL